MNEESKPEFDYTPGKKHKCPVCQREYYIGYLALKCYDTHQDNLKKEEKKNE